MGKQDEAIAAYREAVRLDPKSIARTDALALTLRAQGWLEEARAVYDPMIAALSKTAGVVDHVSLGRALRRAGRPDDAIAEYGKAISLKPGDALVHSNIGNALLDMGKMDEAIAAYGEALRLSSTYVIAQCGLAYAYSRKGQQQDAIAAYRQAIKLKPTSSDIEVLTFGMTVGAQNGVDYLFLAMAHWKRGEEGEARTCYDKGVAWMDKHGPSDAELQRFRAEAAELLGIKDLGGKLTTEAQRHREEEDGKGMRGVKHWFLCVSVPLWFKFEFTPARSA